MRKAKTTAAQAICSGATRQGIALEFTQLRVHGDAVAVNNPMAFLDWARPATVKKHTVGVQSAMVTYQAAGAGSVSSLSDYPISLAGVRIDVEPYNFGSIYRISVDKNDFAKRMPQHKAIHRKNPLEIVTTDIVSSDLEMDPLFFGITNLKDTSGNTIATAPYFKLGEILLIDTKRPNIVISVHDEKHNLTRYAPDSSVFGQFNGYVFINDNQVWTGNPTPSHLGSVNIDGNLISPLLARLQESAGQELEVDSPITFSMLGIDNITASSAISLDWFRLQKILPAPAGTAESVSMPVHRRIFRMDAGGDGETWTISGEVSDKAVGLPLNPVYYQDPYNLLATFARAYRVRTFNDILFVIRNTTLDVRVIDKGQR